MKKMIVPLLVSLFTAICFGSDTANTILRNNFNFGHQLGSIYSRMDDAYFSARGRGRFETGFAASYTSNMPLVRNDYWKNRTMLSIPLYLEIFPSDNISLQFEITDLFVEFPYYDNHSMGGKSPRFKTKIRLRKESPLLPAIAFTAGVKFSSAKPFVIWRNDHNYDESNGLAGAGTGVADYMLLFTFSKKIGPATSIHSHTGLIPVGSPVEYTRGSAQADEIPYGLSLRRDFDAHWSGRVELCGMYNGLSSTKLAHYSVARIRLNFSPAKKGNPSRHTFVLNIEHGLTEESDEWIGGLFGIVEFGKKIPVDLLQ